jgi:hypothetical protein
MSARIDGYVLEVPVIEAIALLNRGAIVAFILRINAQILQINGITSTI